MKICASIILRITELEPEVLANPDIMEEIKKECEENGSQLIDNKIIYRTLSSTGRLSYSFEDDLSRPTVFGKQNAEANDHNTDAPTVEIKTDHVGGILALLFTKKAKSVTAVQREA